MCSWGSIAGIYQQVLCETALYHGHNDFTRMSLGASFSVIDDYFSFITELTYSTELKRTIVSHFICSKNDEPAFEVHLDIEGLEKKGVLKYIYDGTSIPMVFNGLLPDLSFLDASFSESVHASEYSDRQPD